MYNRKPRWINEILWSGEIIEEREPTAEEKKAAEDFEKAVLSNKISEWFNKNNL